MSTTIEEFQPTLDNITEVITDLVKSIVREADLVKISCLARGNLVAFAIKVDQDDVRRVIGQRGKHFRALECIVKEALLMHGKEGHLAIDEKGPPAMAPAVPKVFAMGEFDRSKFKDVERLLKRTVSLFVEKQKSVKVTGSTIATTSVMAVQVKKEDFPRLYGREASFEYGLDGHIIGSFKNFFDGIGKNNGRIIKIVVEQI